VEQAHRERRHAARGQRPDRPASIVLVQRRPHGAVGEDPLADLADEPTRDQRGGLLDLQVVDLIALLAPDDENVAEAAGRQEPDAARLALDDDVGAERRAVDRLRDVRPGNKSLREQRVEAGQARLRGIGIGREPLAGGDLTGGRLEDEVGERPADVEPDSIGGQFRRSPRESTMRYG